jgi:class 3 adenylate cyclase
VTPAFVNCPECRVSVPAGKFCNECGAALPAACPRCGTPNALRARFCNECGAPLGAAATAARAATADTSSPATPAPVVSRPSAETAERRQITLMLCDLVGSTPLSTRLDPEDLREVVGEYQKAVLTAVRAVGGHVAQLLGDGLLIYFGYPTAFEDAAARGCRAALSILDALVVLNGSLSARMGVSIACRIGLHTGTTVIGAMGDDSHVEQLAVGEAPNIVARIQAVASPGAILLSNVTARMVSEEMELESVGVHTLTGAGHPIELFRLLSPRSITRSRRIKGRSATPFVGRRGDLAVLRELWKDAQRGAGRMALIVGEVGVGKPESSRHSQKTRQSTEQPPFSSALVTPATPTARFILSWNCCGTSLVSNLTSPRSPPPGAYGTAARGSALARRRAPC